MVAIAMTYELLHDGPGQLVALDKMLGRFARALAARDMAEGNAAQVKADLAPIEVPADIAVKIGLVVNELATNALKYAFIGRGPGTVSIVLRPAGADGFTLQVSDDGAGMSPEPRRGFGMTVVDSLLRGIDARSEQLPGPGTGFLITWHPRVPPTPEE
jgi:two-component sensor histidine kinase